MKRVISILVEDKFGVLARVSALFAARGFNIDSLSVSKTEDSTVSRIVMTVNDDDCILEQITKQLNKQIDIIEVTNFSDIKYI